MTLSSIAMLKRLGAGQGIAAVREAAGLDPVAFDAWWQAETRARVPPTTGTCRAAVRRAVRIDRDALGIPHIHADDDTDLFFAFGYAMSQDRLFQLDYLRRRGSGRLAEILGPDGTDLDLLSRTAGIRSLVELDLLHRTVGIRRIAEAEWASLPDDTRTLLEAFSRGIDAQMEDNRDRLPIEFDLLDYRPEPWSPIDCLTIEIEFRWYLTGRFPVIVVPELARRALGDGPLYRAFLQVEEDDESILPPGSYPSRRSGTQPVGVAVSEPDSAVGSNNWVLAGTRTRSGKPLVATDPHIAFDAVSCWYTAHLHGGSFHVTGTAYVGMPAILFGRTREVAWGCTNNICSQRDLYLEKTDPAHPDQFLYDGRWEPARRREEVIHVRGGESIRETIRYSRNGPIVDAVLPPPARGTGPIALRWLGASEGGWLTALLGMNRAHSAEEFREALRPWHVPTFSVVFADDQGHVGFQATGRIPVREVWERGYRPGWDPRHQWQGLIPFEGMPRLSDPSQGWIATANNRPAPEDYPYPLSGTWNDGQRARRIRQMIEARDRHSRQDCAVMHLDSLSLRGVRCPPGLLAVLAGHSDGLVQQAVHHLKVWDGTTEPDRVGATLFEVFFSHWTRTVARERFEPELAAFLAGGTNGLSAALLAGDTVGWFATPGRREQAIREAMGSALAWLSERLGPDVATWTWGRLHVLPLRHVLSGRGDLGTLLDHGGKPVPGNAHTVCNTGLGANFESRTGAGYRHLADLGEAAPGLWAVDAQSQSGHPGSPRYADQFETWLRGEYHYLAMAGCEGGERLTLEPG